MARRKLKVFQAQFGFYDTVVAASSQAAALRVWGTHQNLFASGEAKIATDEAAVQAALKLPETPLRRVVGSKDPFQLVPASLPKAPDAPARPAASAGPKPTAPTKPAADRTALAAAEAALQKLDERGDNSPVLAAAVRRDVMMPGVWAARLSSPIHFIRSSEGAPSSPLIRSMAAFVI
jgi:hypothetical protein